MDLGDITDSTGFSIDYDSVSSHDDISSNENNENKVSKDPNCKLRESWENKSLSQLTISQNSINYTELTRADIERIIGMKPIDIIKYKKAFVHKSVTKNAREDDNLPIYMKDSYERYEFLGDSVLNLVIAQYIFKKYPNSHEGILTKLRTKLVNGKTLSRFANLLGLSKYLILNYKVENINGRNNNRILEDVFEALICAIYLDLGFEYAEKFIINLLVKHINFEELIYDDNFKDILLRFCQNKFNCAPTYEIKEIVGPPHNRIFKSCCLIDGLEYKFGKGKCKKEAEQNAAKETLKHFKIINE